MTPTGLDVPQPEKLDVKISDGEVIAHWRRPADAPSNSQYDVRMAKYSGDWAAVAGCTGINTTYCDLTSLVHDYRSGYKVKVQLVSGEDASAWTLKKFLPNTSELQPPSFNLWATSSTLTVYVHEKPILKKIFPYGLIYTIHLEERGQHEKNTTAYLRDDVGEDQRTKSFASLGWGREYCVSIRVEGLGAPTASSASPRQCLLLPEQEWFLVAVSSLAVLGVLVSVAIVVTVLLCYLRRPENKPAALKSPASGWLPLSVGEGPMELVTDKGWFLSSDKKEAKNRVKDRVAAVTDDDREEDRRTSTDSGLGIESNSAPRHEDSGCGSLGEEDTSTSCHTDYPLKEERSDADGGAGLRSSSVNLEAQGGGSLLVPGVNYRSHAPPSSSSVRIQVCDDDEEEEERYNRTLPEVFAGYRAGLQCCVCSGAGRCAWCRERGHREAERRKRYGASCVESGRPSAPCDFVDSLKGPLTFLSYSKRTQMDTVVVDDSETTFLRLAATFPLLTALSPPPPPLVAGGRDFNTNRPALSLCDVQLTAD
ncbi:Interleukin-10 receptor subunit alpha [Liparis tanakae]|uniref:Interleukin-10 receptor subunit alpha n=1 Tax=Liparis tanakae TaxID=230148 RepID=A0A4Z2GCW3_9TELE|nr:Interleukin-10 receptor subunit alpha [Liparis tanakae]